MNATILIIDDSLTVRMDLMEAFAAEDMRAIACETATAARKALAREDIGLIVLDVLLPDADGVDLLKEIRSRPQGADTPVLILSTEADIRNRIRGLMTGSDDYIGKPYDRDYVVARAAELLRRRESSACASTATILVIDDSPTCREDLCEALTRKGYKVLSAASGEEGLRAAATHRPTAVIVDGVLPGIDGATVVRKLRLDAALRQTPCILLTGSTTDMSAELRALDAGADAFVRKQDDPDVILARVAAVLRAAAGADAPGATESLLGPKRILAVDDSLTYLEELALILRGEGYDMVLARSGEEALDMLAVQPVDCILLDLLMPGLGGTETCQRIKASSATRDIPLVMLTANEDREAMIESLSAGADDYVLKSSPDEVLKARVRAQLRRKQIEDESRRIRLQLVRKELEAAGARALREAHDQLEVRVRERTAQLRAQFERLHLLGQITRAIIERQDVNSIFQVVIRTLEEHLPADFCCMCLHDASKEQLTVTNVGARSTSLAMQPAVPEQMRIDIDGNGLSPCVHGRAVYETELVETGSPFARQLAGGGLHSLLATPLLVEGKLFAVLIAARRDPRSFSSGECEFLQQLSEHVALAAHQAQLYQSLQHAYDDLRRTQEAVMQQERLRALGEMASGIAHDINNAISPISLYAESLLERAPDLPDQARSHLQIIQRAIDDVAETVGRMREFYRAREPQQMMLPVDVNRLVLQVLDLTRARWSDMVQQRGIVIDVRTDLAPNLPAVLGIESELRDALMNLIFNAVDAMPEGGQLHLRTRFASAAQASSPSGVLLDIVDSGVGMDEETRRRCLEPFFTTKGERGTGLGLAMVYGTVKRHGAALEITSAIGQGTTIRLSFPAAQESVGSASRPEMSHFVRSLRILLVDDEPLVLQSLRDTLEADSHLVTTADGGQAGIDAYRAARAAGRPFQVVITDLGMPYVDGRAVSRAVKSADAGTVVLLLTGWGRRLVEDGETPPDVDRVLSKPPKLSELREALARYFAPDASLSA